MLRINQINQIITKLFINIIGQRTIESMKNYLSQSNINRSSNNQERIIHPTYLQQKSQNKQNQKPRLSLLRDFTQKHCNKLINQNALNPFQIKQGKSDFLKQSQVDSYLHSQFSTTIKSNYNSRCLSKDAQCKQTHQSQHRNFSYSKSFGNLKLSFVDQCQSHQSPAKTEKLALNESQIHSTILQKKLKNVQHLKKQLQTKYQGEKIKLQQQKRLAQAKIETFYSQNSELRKKNIQFQAIITLLSEKSNQLEQKYLCTSKKLSQTERMFEKQKNEISNLKINYQYSLQKIQGQKMSKAIQSIKQLSYRLQKVEKQNQKLQKQLQNQGKLYQGTIRKLKDQFCTIQSRNQEYQAQQQLWKRQLDNLKDERQANLSRIKLLQHQFELSTRQNAQLNQYVVSLNQSNICSKKQSTKAIQNLKSQLEKKEKQINKINKEIQKRQNLNKQMKLQYEAKIKAIQIDYKSLQVNSSKAQKVSSFGKSSIQKQNQNNKEQKQIQIVELKKQLSSAIQKIRQQQRIHKQYGNNMENKMKSLRQQIYHKNDDIQAMKQQKQRSRVDSNVEQVNQSKVLQRTQINNHLQAVEQCSQQSFVIDLEQKYRQNEIQKATMKAQNQNLKDKLQSLKVTIQQLKSYKGQLEIRSEDKIHSLLERCQQQQRQLMKLRSKIFIIQEQKYQLKKMIEKRSQQQSQIAQINNQKLNNMQKYSYQSQPLYSRLIKAQQQLKVKDLRIGELCKMIQTKFGENSQNQSLKKQNYEQSEIGLRQIKTQQCIHRKLQENSYQSSEAIKSLQKKVYFLQNQITRATNLHLKLQSDKLKLQKNSEQILQRFKNLQAQKKELMRAFQDKMRLAQQKKINQSEKIQLLTNKNLEINQTIDRLNEICRKLEEEAETLKAKFDRSQAQLQNAIKKNKSCKQQYQELQKSLIQFRDKYELQMNQRKGIIDREIQLLKQQFIQDKDGISMTAKQQMQTVLKQLQILQALNSQKKKQIDQMRQQNQRTKYMAIQKQDQLRKQAKQDSYRYESTINQLSTQLRGLHERNRNLIQLNDQKQANIEAIRVHQRMIEGQFIKQLKQMELQLQAHVDKNQRTSNLLIELDLIRQQNAKYKNHIYELEDSKTQMKENINILNNKLIRTDEQLSKQRSEKQKYYIEAEGLSTIVQKLENVVKIKQQQQHKLLQKCKVLNEESEHLQESVRALKNSNDELYQKAVQSEKAYKKASDKTLELQKDIISLKRQIQELLYITDQEKRIRNKNEQSLAQYKNKIREIEQMLNWKQQEMKKMREKSQKKLDQKQAEVIRLQKQKTKLCEKIDLNNKLLQQKDNLIADLERSSNKQKAMIVECQIQVSRYKTKRDQLVKQMQQQQKKIIELRNLLIDEKQKTNDIKNRHCDQMQIFKADYQTLYLKYQKYKDLAKANKEKVQAHRTVARSHMRIHQQILNECKNQIGRC